MNKNSSIYKFKLYLTNDKRFAESTVDSYLKSVNYYLEWRQSKDLKSKVSYLNILDFIEKLKKKKYSYGSIHVILTAIKHYYNYKNVRVNPVQHIKLKGREKKVINGLLTDEQMIGIYNSYKKQTIKNCHVHRRNTVILGLICFQGIKTNEISKIRLDKVCLDSLKVFIPSTKRANERTLHLRSEQLIDLYTYLNESRQYFLAKLSLVDSDYLIIGNQRETDLSTIFMMLPPTIKNENSYFINFLQLRSSRIVLWLKSHNLRMVQYMAGHRYVSSTELFKVNDLTQLKEALINKHPLG